MPYAPASTCRDIKATGTALAQYSHIRIRPAESPAVAMRPGTLAPMPRPEPHYWLHPGRWRSARRRGGTARAALRIPSGHKAPRPCTSGVESAALAAGKKGRLHCALVAQCPAVGPGPCELRDMAGVWFRFRRRGRVMTRRRLRSEGAGGNLNRLRCNHTRHI